MSYIKLMIFVLNLGVYRGSVKQSAQVIMTAQESTLHYSMH